MRIVVSPLLLQNDHLEGVDPYANEIIYHLIKTQPENEFIFYFNRSENRERIVDAKQTPDMLLTKVDNLLADIYWNVFKSPKRLDLKKVDIWIQPNAIACLNTQIPQIVIIQNIESQVNPNKVAWYYRRLHKLFMKKFINKAKCIITSSEIEKKALIQHYPFASHKVIAIKGSANQSFQPIEWQEKEQVKAGFTDSREYFLFAQHTPFEGNMMNVLKAFSLFKNWQQSNMKLLVFKGQSTEFNQIEEKLKTYKYREDVILLRQFTTEQLIRITAAAYAFIFPSSDNGSGLQILDAMQCEVPVIAGNVPANQEIGGEAALYVNFSDPDAIAKEMLSLYKDESQRTKLIEAGKTQAATQSWNNAGEQLWLSICKTIQKG